MKRTQWKDALRNIWKQKVSWLSIVVIAFLAVAAYTGISFGASALKRGGAAFYEETNFRDEEIVSTLLLSEADLQALRETEGVLDAEGVYQTAGSVANGDVRQEVSVLSLTERIDLPQLLSGRLPETSGECAVEQPVMKALGLAVGDTIEITDAQGGCAEYLRVGSYVITGVVYHPDHLSWPDIIPGNRYILVLPEDFDLDALDGSFMKAELRLEKPEGVTYYDEGYTEALAATEQRLSALADERTPMRRDEIQARFETEIDDGQAELDSGAAELADARAELDDGWRQLADGEEELADGEKRLAEAKAELEEVWQRLLDAQEELADAKAQLADAKAQLDSGAAELNAAESRLASARSQLIAGWEELEDVKETIRDMIRTGVETALGEEAAASIRWAARQSADLSSSGASAVDFRVTDDVRFDLSLSLEDNILNILSSSDIPDETLIAAYENLMGGGGE